MAMLLSKVIFLCLANYYVIIYQILSYIMHTCPHKNDIHVIQKDQLWKKNRYRKLFLMEEKSNKLPNRSGRDYKFTKDL